MSRVLPTIHHRSWQQCHAHVCGMHDPHASHNTWLRNEPASATHPCTHASQLQHRDRHLQHRDRHLCSHDGLCTCMCGTVVPFSRHVQRAGRGAYRKQQPYACSPCLGLNNHGHFERADTTISLMHTCRFESEIQAREAQLFTFTFTFTWYKADACACCKAPVQRAQAKPHRTCSCKKRK